MTPTCVYCGRLENLMVVPLVPLVAIFIGPYCSPSPLAAMLEAEDRLRITDVTPRVLRAGVVVRPRACPSVPVFLRRCSGVFPLGAAAIVTRAPLPGRGLGRATQGARTAPFFRQTVNAPPRRSCRSARCSRAVVRGTAKRWARARGRPPGAVRRRPSCPAVVLIDGQPDIHPHT